MGNIHNSTDKLIQKYEALINDIHLNHLYKLKNNMISLVKPKIIINLDSGEYKYIIEDDNIKLIDGYIEERVNYLKSLL